MRSFETSGASTMGGQDLPILADALAELHKGGRCAEIDGSIIDLSNPQLPGTMMPIGLRVAADKRANTVFCFWAPQLHLDPNTPRGTPIGQSVARAELHPGERLWIAKVVPQASNDPTITDQDRHKFLASLAITKRDGSEQLVAEPITFSTPDFMDGGKELVRPDVRKMLNRLEHLWTSALGRDGKPNFPLLVAILETENRRGLMTEIRGEIATESPRLYLQLDELQDRSAAFGYALGRAEAELMARPARRKEHAKAIRGGRSRANSKQQKAAEWKAEALEEAEDLDKKNPPITRGGMATHILTQFNWQTPTLRTVEIWLKEEAEHPNGPIRSRRRTPKLG